MHGVSQNPPDLAAPAAGHPARITVPLQEGAAEQRRFSRLSAILLRSLPQSHHLFDAGPEVLFCAAAQAFFLSGHQSII